MASTIKPTGLTVSRNGGLVLDCEWKIADKDYDGGQQFQWRTTLTETWTTVSVTARETSKRITLTAGDYYPTQGRFLKGFYFRVRGKRATAEDSRTGTTTNYAWSAWTQKGYPIDPPRTPTITATLDSTLENKTAFSWETDVRNDDRLPFVRTRAQTILTRACAEGDGSKLTWNSAQPGWAQWTAGASNTSNPREITEESELLAADSYTRWVRVRSEGAAGASAWRYAKHVYATPYKPKIAAAKVESATGTQTAVSVRWTAASNKAHPIDEVRVEYVIATPAAGLACPSGASWTTAAGVADTAGEDSVRFVIDDTVGLDECLWVRVVSKHDSRETACEPVRIRVGRLTDPSGLTVSNIDSSTYRATITATNNSSVPDSFLAVRVKVDEPTYYTHSGFEAEGYCCGIIPAGQSSVTVQCMSWDDSGKVAFGVTACQGTYELIGSIGHANQYAVTANMHSGRLWAGGVVPAAPTRVVASRSAEGEVLVDWNWSWSTANRAEISWSMNENAWESTEPPETYIVDTVSRSDIRVPGLETGTWYFRVRLGKETNGEMVWGPYSETKAVELGTAPEKPILALSAAVMRYGKDITASWTYRSTDGTEQSYADVREVTVDGDTVTVGSRLAKATTEKSKTFRKTGTAWGTGTTHYVAVRVWSGSGMISEWSDPVPVTVANPAQCAITETPLVIVSNVARLEGLPINVTVTGAGEGGVTSLAIERTRAYQMDRPDESVFQGYEGETVWSASQTGETPFTIRADDLVGMLDDGAYYRFVATVQDGLGQSATATRNFKVVWRDQAKLPTATVTMDTENAAAIITPTCSDAAAGSVCDIYRLSADRPELIVRGGTWGQRYVDPYPAIGPMGGHRVVYRTANGDYIRSGNQPAWIDLGEADGDTLDLAEAVIDWDGNQVRLPHNLNLSSTWSKDFRETRYLGGSVQGDWNPAVGRTGALGAVVIVSSDPETIRGLRRLASWAGVCHVRTPEGSSFAADVQVSESRETGRGRKLASFTLNVTRVDPEEPDGLPYEEWIEGVQ